jgi:hypothetical protein
MKRVKALLIIILLISIYILFFIFDLRWECIFKKVIHIACPGCGLTRSLKSILSLDIISSIKYNILGIPVLIFGVITIIIALRDFIKAEDTLMPVIYKMAKKYYKFIFIILIITMIINNINGV